MNNKNAWQCYILQCADNTFYTGITNNLQKRIAAHNAGTASKYTRSRLPVLLVYAEPHNNRSDASKREAHIKRLDRVQKFALMKSNSASATAEMHQDSGAFTTTGFASMLQPEA